MICCLNRHAVRTIGLTSSLMPDEVVLTTSKTPWWNQDVFNAIWSDNVSNNRIKCPCYSIVILNWKGTTWSCIINSYYFFSNVVTIIWVIYNISICSVVSFIAFMLTRLDSGAIATISLLSCLMPDEVILTIFKTPWRNQNFLNTQRCSDISNDGVKCPILSIVILNCKICFWS